MISEEDLMGFGYYEIEARHKRFSPTWGAIRTAVKLSNKSNCVVATVAAPSGTLDKGRLTDELNECLTLIDEIAAEYEIELNQKVTDEVV